jgi:hypothetical protein
MNNQNNKLCGIELLRYAVRLFSRCNETFNQQFDEQTLLKIAATHKACEWDFYPDQWTDRQLSDLFHDGKIPEWDKNEQPKYSE